MESFEGRLAVVTGGGTGIGRELVRQLAGAGADVAMCDVNSENMAGTARLVGEDGSTTKVSRHVCDVSDPTQVAAFRVAVEQEHDTECVHLLFNNAGIAGGGSFVADDPAAWERTFDICWGGVYVCARAFVPMLVRAPEAAIVNTSSINGVWASVGADRPHTSYCAAKFAVRGFTEALIADFRVNAPHVSAHVVMPGHIGTSIAINTVAAHGGVDVVSFRKLMGARGFPVDQMSDDDIVTAVADRGAGYRDNAPTTAAQAATIILEGVKAGEWRILVGEDAVAIDEMVRADPTGVYEPEFIDRLVESGHFIGLVRG